MPSTQGVDPAKAASDYFNSLPFEERKKLAPLLEEYRRMGIEEARREIEDVRERLQRRVASIKRMQQDD